jgi:hypothetical protein
MELLKNLLSNHDFFYSRSDDHNKWVNGLQSEEAIRDEMDRLGNTQEVQDLYYNSIPSSLKDSFKIAS